MFNPLFLASFLLRGWLLTICTVLLVGCDSGTESSEQPNQPVVKQLVLEFLYGSEKKNWLEEVTSRFNATHHTLADGTIIRVHLQPMGSGEAIEDVLQGRKQAHLLSPASDVFIKLGNAQSQLQLNQDLLGPTENLVLSPVVIAMWKPMAEALGWPNKALGWSDILDLAKNPQGWAAYNYPQWGKFKFGHTHPDYSNSGLISLLAEVYAGANKLAGLSVADIQQPKVAEYLNEIEQSVVHYGRSTGFFGEKLMNNGPGYLSAAVLYENMVIQSYSHQALAFPIVAIYPKEGTFWSDHPVGIVNRPWVTAQHREAAQQYLDYLLAEPQQQLALKHGFRPGNVHVALASPLDAAHGIDPHEPKTTLEVPKVEVIHAIKELWYQNKRSANIVLVLDTSGSMSGVKMDNARLGAQQLLGLLHDNDQISLLPFDSNPRWSGQNISVGTHRLSVKKQIASLFANGGTALYDAVGEAYNFIAHAPQDRISAIVVLSDGADTDSRHLDLTNLLKKIRFDSEDHPVRIFTIGYGSGASKDILEKIAETTQAKFYQGSPENIHLVFREISTFF